MNASCSVSEIYQGGKLYLQYVTIEGADGIFQSWMSFPAEAQRNLGNDSITLEELDKHIIEKADPLRLKYRLYRLTGPSTALELFVLAVIVAVMVSLFYIYYFAT